MGQLLDYYGTLLNRTTRDWQAKRAIGFTITSWIVLKSSTVAPLFWVEAILCLLHVPPIAGLDDKWGLLIIVRFYMVLRLLRDYSTVYQNRANIAHNYNSLPPKFNWALSTKTFYAEHPLIFLFILSMLVLFVCGYVTYIFERYIFIICAVH